MLAWASKFTGFNEHMQILQVFVFGLCSVCSVSNHFLSFHFSSRALPMAPMVLVQYALMYALV